MQGSIKHYICSMYEVLSSVLPISFCLIFFLLFLLFWNNDILQVKCVNNDNICIRRKLINNIFANFTLSFLYVDPIGGVLMLTLGFVKERFLDLICFLLSIIKMLTFNFQQQCSYLQCFC